MVEDVVVEKSIQFNSSCRNYLEEKLLRTLASVEEERSCVQNISKKLKDKVEYRCSFCLVKRRR